MVTICERSSSISNKNGTDMSHIRNIDKEEYAKKAFELFEQERESFVKFAYEQLKEGADSLLMSSIR